MLLDEDFGVEDAESKDGSEVGFVGSGVPVANVRAGCQSERVCEFRGCTGEGDRY